MMIAGYHTFVNFQQVTSRHFRIHGDNIVECERAVQLVRDAMGSGATISSPDASLTCPKYTITSSNFYFIVDPKINKVPSKEWVPNIIPVGVPAVLPVVPPSEVTLEYRQKSGYEGTPNKVTPFNLLNSKDEIPEPEGNWRDYLGEIGEKVFENTEWRFIDRFYQIKITDYVNSKKRLAEPSFKTSIYP